MESCGSGESWRVYLVFVTWTIRDIEVKPGKEERPAKLSGVESFCSLNV